MATIVKLQVFPEINLNHHKLRRGFGSSNSSGVFGFGHNFNGLLSLKKCRAFKSEDSGDFKEKKIRNLKKNEVKIHRENGFWSSFRSILLGNFMVGSKLDDEYRQAVVRVDEVLSKVSSCFLLCSINF
jgi:chlorophyll(ide) b reductase